MAHRQKERTRRDLPDEMPRSVISDGILSIRGRIAGRGGPRSILFAALGLIFLVGLVIALWAASHFSPRPPLEAPPANVSRS